jgi:ABC-type Fe3+ transport system substrate-binding protein
VIRKIYARAFLSFLVSLAAFLVACQRQVVPEGRDANKRTDEVTVYVSTDRVFTEPILQAYERKTGVKVNAVYDTEETKSTGLANKLVAEKNNPQADVFWSNEPVRTLVLKSRGAPRAEAGKKLIDYLLSAEVERELARSEAVQIPLHSGVEGPKNILLVTSFKPMTLDYGKAAGRVEDVVKRLQPILGL